LLGEGDAEPLPNPSADLLGIIRVARGQAQRGRLLAKDFQYVERDQPALIGGAHLVGQLRAIATIADAGQSAEVAQRLKILRALTQIKYAERSLISLSNTPKLIDCRLVVTLLPCQ
jgi:hypothetical protein